MLNRNDPQGKFQVASWVAQTTAQQDQQGREPAPTSRGTPRTSRTRKPGPYSKCSLFTPSPALHSSPIRRGSKAAPLQDGPGQCHGSVALWDHMPATPTPCPLSSASAIPWARPRCLVSATDAGVGLRAFCSDPGTHLGQSPMLHTHPAPGSLSGSLVAEATVSAWPRATTGSV